MEGGDVATLGLYQVVDMQWRFVVSCDWQCRPLDQPEQPRQSTAVAPTPQGMDEKDAQMGLFVSFCQSFFLYSEIPSRMVKHKQFEDS